MFSGANKIDRRTFIRTAAPFALAAPVLYRGRLSSSQSIFTGEDVARARQRLLAMVNRERGERGLSRLELDDLANRVAADHARDMVEGLYLSHWDRDGRKPYHRYSFAGGTDATQENGSRADDYLTETAEQVEKTLAELHQSMLDEVPPNDGHRQTILFPHHTHAGFGIAVKPDHIRMVQLYVARYATIPRMRRTASPGAQINFSGKLLNPSYSIEGIHVHYEPLPKPPSLEFLRQLRSYSLPEPHEELFPRLNGADVYEDGTKGTIETTSSGEFRAPVLLFKEPGINTIVVWISRTKSEEPFPITQVCIRCE